ncbi:MAG: UvrD-helicase domain-containing protein, partial [Patescibacteria group bacterium]
ISDFKFSAKGGSASGGQISNLNTSTPWIGTFHALGVYLLRRDGHHIGIPRSFTILDEEDALSIVRRIIKERHLDPKQFQPPRIRHIISALKNKPFIASDENESAETDYYPQEIKDVHKRYEEELTSAHALDFDDLLLRTEELFRTHAAVLEKWQHQWQHIMIDEYQDTNRLQYILTTQLAKKNRNIMVVGDVDQAIYSWRGADFRNILSFENDWPDAKTITLEENYRSTNTILTAANTIIQKNKERKEKNLWTKRGAGPHIELAVAQNEREEALLIAREIERLRETGTPLHEMAVLYRTNAQSRVLEEAFIRNNIPYRLIGGTRFYERREIKDILAYMRLAVNKNDSVSLRRVLNTPPRGIGAVLTEKFLSQKNLSAGEQARIDAFWNIINVLETTLHGQPPSALAQCVIEKSGYEACIRDGMPEGEDRWANVQELLSVTSAY